MSAAAASAEPALERLHSLAGYQALARDGLRDTVRRIAALQASEPRQRAAIARELGVMLLQAPTASGKTLILGRTLESLRGAVLGKFVWFWFAPFSGLVEQTKDVLSAQCPSLRLRDIASDRAAAGTRDGDVFIQTWATVAANNADARRVRRRAEDSGSIDDLIADLRDKDFSIGVVIDEAHVNFGSTAKAAAAFYLDVLRPDAAILATATPNDAKLEAFEAEAGIRVAGRAVIDRRDVVDAGLNKVGLYLGLLRFSEDDAKLVDPEQAALKAGWSQHCRIREHLAKLGIGVTPLMLVQVEDQKKGEPDPVDRAREKLEQFGVPRAAIRAHTSGKPDPDFHALAYDPKVEVLIFKVAVATGFDAPRAWTLVSVRPNRGVEFGLQIVGRIMRVHPAVRHLHGKDDLLDNGYVILTDPELQGGLDQAVAELKAVRQSIDMVTDHLNVVQFGSGAPVLQDIRTVGPARTPLSDVERVRRIGDLVEQGVLKATIYDQSPDFQERVLQAAEAAGATRDLFGDLPLGTAERKPAPDRPAKGLGYRLRAELGVPEALQREELPQMHAMGAGFADLVAREFVARINLPNYLVERGRSGSLSLRELFEGRKETQHLAVPISSARAADLAQRAFAFNDQIDPRDLKRAILSALRGAAARQAIEPDEKILRRAVDLAALENEPAMREAVRAAQRRHMVVASGDTVPRIHFDEKGREPARKGAYGIFPSGMNGPEWAFARFLDEDESGRVLWWLRCVENTRWAPKLVLPDGHNFFPDFAVGVVRRSKPDGIALIEIKDDGETGRLQADRNIIKARVAHLSYGKVFWTTLDKEDVWVRLLYDDRANRLLAHGRFDLANLIFD